MHEFSLAQALIEQVMAVAQTNRLISVDEVHIETGVLKQVIPEIMCNAFAIVSENTLAEKAVLTIEEIKAEAVCNRCGCSFEPERDNFLCPFCLKADVKIKTGNDIILKKVISYKGAESGQTTGNNH